MRRAKEPRSLLPALLPPRRSPTRRLPPRSHTPSVAHEPAGGGAPAAVSGLMSTGRRRLRVVPQRSPGDSRDSSYCNGLDGPIPPCPPDEAHQPPPSPFPLPPPPHAASHGRSTFATALIIAVPVLAFVTLCLSILIFVHRRRLRRRRREALLEAVAALTPAAFPDDDDGDGPGAGGDVVHHVWHIRTVGLDDAAIESIALTRYRAAGGGGVLGASDCTVCLGEFQDGELVRLLPKCAHAFHVQCIDTWLRAHVTCPLCRADVTMDAPSAAAADAEQPPGADAADGASGGQPATSSTRTMEHDPPGQQGNEQQEHRVQIDQSDHSSSPELERPRRQIPHLGARAHNFRRVASMDSPTASAEEAPEDEQLQAGGEKQGTCGAACCEVSPEPAGHQLKRSLSASNRWTLLSRHCRTRSSLLPL